MRPPSYLCVGLSDRVQTLLNWHFVKIRHLQPRQIIRATVLGSLEGHGLREAAGRMVAGALAVLMKLSNARNPSSESESSETESDGCQWARIS